MYPYFIQQVIQRNIKTVEKLLQDGVDPNIQDSQGRTALFYAKEIEMFKLLLENKADINHESIDGEHLLSYLASDSDVKDKREVINFLLAYPSLDINFKNKTGTSLILQVCMGNDAYFLSVLSVKKSLREYIVKTLIEKECKVDDLYHWLKGKAYYTYKMVGYSCRYNIRKIAELILSTISCFSQEHDIGFYLKKLFILSASILKNDALLAQSMQLKSTEEDDFLKSYKDTLLKSKNESLPYQKEMDDISKVFTDIQTIFRNPSLCLTLLKDLDNAVRAKCEKNGVDINSIEQDNRAYLYSSPLVWAVPKNLNEEYPFKTNNILSNTLLDREEEWDINVDKKVYTFKGHVPDYLAKKFIKSGHIFVEYLGNALHGTNEHRIQWDMVETASKLNILDTRGFTTKQLLKASVDDGWWDTVFDNLADSLNEDYFPNTGYSSPQTLYSRLLLLQDELPFLSYFARKSLVQNLQKVQKLNPEYSNLTLYGLFTLTNGSFGIFKLNSFNPEVYYANRKHLTFFEKSFQVYAKQLISPSDVNSAEQKYLI